MKLDTVAAQGVRLQKVIAQAGVTSRRKAEARVAMSPRARMSNIVPQSSTCSNGSRYGSFPSDVWM